MKLLAQDKDLNLVIVDTPHFDTIESFLQFHPSIESVLFELGAEGYTYWKTVAEELKVLNKKLAG